MLVLSRNRGERLRLLLPGGGEVWVEVLELLHDRVRLGITGPKEVQIDREERLTASAEGGETE